MRRLILAVAAAIVAGPAAARDMNISQFVFRDENRNGVFDLGESPFSGADIRLDQETGEAVYRSSNLAGFANFPMSDDEEDADIRAPGPVKFSIELPEGFVLTTGNPEQTAEISALAEAPGGFVMDPPNAFMGLAPALTIESSGKGVASMTCSTGYVELTAVPKDGGLVCWAAPGRWKVDWQMVDGSFFSREVVLSEWPVRVPIAATGSEGSRVMVESFDGIINSENIQEMAAADGFVWHNMIAVHRKFYGGWGYVNGTVSGEFSGYNSSGHPASISSDRPFEFRGAYVSVAWPKGMNAPVRFRAYRGGELVGEEAFHASNLRPLWFEPRWAGIDRLEISHDAYWQVVLDDVTLAR